MITRIATLLGLLLLCTISIARVARAPTAVPSSAPDTVFSAERAMRHVEQIAARPHPMGSIDHGRVRDYIAGQLAALGIPPQIQVATAVGTRYQAAGRVQNVMARLPGGSRTAGRTALLLMAHYDGVGAGPAASDDAAGAAAILETLRAIRALNRPLGHDVIALFTDGEEAGLLGAAAFVREHPWAKDVAMVLNFEARGTTGRSVMFETGPGNLDAARALRAAGNATAGSVYATVYRALPNDTDLSELAALGLPALNFAFAAGVERYHTSRDDVAHLNPGSVQHHGSQMLALTREIANGALPRPRTGDGVFFDLPLAGLIVYPVGRELPLALLCALVVGVLAVRQGQRVLIGVLAAVAAVVLSALTGAVAGSLASGPAAWSGWYAAAEALVAIALTTACWAIARRWAPPPALRLGALVLWTIVALAAAMKAPGVAYLFEWPLLLAAIAVFVEPGRGVATWLASAVTLLILAGFIYGVSVVMLGLAGAGAIALAIVVSLVTLIIMPQIERVAGNASLLGAPWTLGIALVVMAAVALGVRPSADHPLRSALVYAEAVDANDAWLGSLGGLTNGWLRQAIGTPVPAPSWTSRLSDGSHFAGHSVERAPLAQPTATLVGDTMIDGARRVVLRVTAPPGATDLAIRASGAKVSRSAIDGRLVDPTRYRYHSPDWRMDYWAVPDSGAIVALSIPVGAQIDVELTSHVPGLPSLPGVTIPARPPNVVPSQGGDMSMSYGRWRF